MLNAAIAAHQLPVKGKATLDDHLVDTKMDAWVDQFLGALKPIADDAEALNDRTTARGYLKGADREAYSMLHKALELPALRAEILGEKESKAAGPVQVSFEDIQKALQQPGLRDALKRILRDRLPGVYARDAAEATSRAGAFSGADDMGQLLASALGTHLLGALDERHGKLKEGLDGQVKASQAALEELAKQLSLSDGQLRALRNTNSDLEKTIKDLERQLRSEKSAGAVARDQVEDLTAQVAKLKRAAQTEREAVTTRRNYSSGYSYASSGGS
jgi:hypothetical protein